MPGPGRAGAPSLRRVDDYFVARFRAMASRCEFLIDTNDRAQAASLARLVEHEALRIEHKFSRYRPDGVVHAINRAGGAPVTLDDESAGLLDYAALCHEMSGGMFDVTSGVLRRAWTFDGGDRVPEPGVLAPILALVGWHRLRWERPVLTMPAGMELDLGGLGKEYAVDRAAALVADRTRKSFLVNFGGDLFASGPRRGERPWAIGVDDPEHTGEAWLYRVDLTSGGLATSGDARRYVTWQGRRLGHILDPRSGWPVEGAPRSITVLAPTCVEAGTLSTLAYLRGPGARAFLEEQAVEFRIL